MLTNQEEVIASAGLSGPTSLVPATSDVRQLDPTHRVISRERFQRTINDLGSIAGDARVIPLRRDGRNIGWQVTSLQPGSLLASIGLKDGDTLLRINGFKLDAPEKALEAYQRLREAVVFDLDIERAGAPVRMNYRVGE
jgi:general secretion pathway protein C